MSALLKPLSRCYACPRPAVLRVTNGGIGKCRECHEQDRADPWGAAARVIDETFQIAKGGGR